MHCTLTLAFIYLYPTCFQACLSLHVSKKQVQTGKGISLNVITTGRQRTLGFKPRTYKVSVTTVKGTLVVTFRLIVLTLHSTHIHQHGSQFGPVDRFHSCRFKCCCRKALWYCITSFPYAKDGPAYPTLNDKRNGALKHRSSAFREFKQL